MAFNSQAVMTPYRINGINMINVPLGKDSNSRIDIPCEKNILSPLRLVYHHSYSFWKYFMIFSHWGQFYKHLLNSWWLYVVIYVVIHPFFNPDLQPERPCNSPQELRSVTGHPMILADDLIEASSSVGATCRDGGGRWLDVKIERFIILLVLSREFSGMIHWLAINFMIPATPIAIHSLRLAQVSL